MDFTLIKISSATSRCYQTPSNGLRVLGEQPALPSACPQTLFPVFPTALASFIQRRWDVREEPKGRSRVSAHQGPGPHSLEQETPTRLCLSHHECPDMWGVPAATPKTDLFQFLLPIQVSHVPVPSCLPFTNTCVPSPAHANIRGKLPLVLMSTVTANTGEHGCTPALVLHNQHLPCIY